MADDFLSHPPHPSSMSKTNYHRQTLSSRTTASLLGLALGDAIGLYTEFLSASESRAAYPQKRFILWSCPPGPPTPFHMDSHRAQNEEGDWTDDTDHCLLVLLAFLHTARMREGGEGVEAVVPIFDGEERGSFAVKVGKLPLPSATDLAERLSIWVRCGLRALDTLPLGLGALVGNVVRSPDFLGDPMKVARSYWTTHTAPNGDKLAPNGSLMRTAPVGLICLWKTEEECFRLAAELGKVTHADPRCVVACVVGSALVRGLVRGEVESGGDVTDLIRRGVEWYKNEGSKMDGAVRDTLDEQEVWRFVGHETTLADLKLDEEGKIGYVYKTLGAGVVLLRKAFGERMKSDGPRQKQERFERLITQLVMEGGDADTNACFAGALLGATMGQEALPDHWRNGLNHGKWLSGKATALCRVLGLEDGKYNGKEDLDTHPDGGRGILSREEMDKRWRDFDKRTRQKMDAKRKR
ncbi:ADP-ribosylglycohydrolase-domain-containing protein [Sordaria brevicollis]|uniref:ADP-ribosylglycohydrolase-domain-containing protein n=1 Tax=Sordaria brevicollis TaxID=83679 RepID=A0AAE0U0C2_SORBR|nr:ADP-ribosylglycohydrolase-domain-containing protein [Sordaria brevicollis]